MLPLNGKYSAERRTIIPTETVGTREVTQTSNVGFAKQNDMLFLVCEKET